jgi:UDP-2,4-diacetamido-2,4,6-trideoxy-beta-L-altropyranose hydrolase
MNLLIRADANLNMGTGHVMRCLALGQTWCDWAGRVTFVMSAPPRALVERVQDERISIVELDKEAGSRDDAAFVADLRARRGAKAIVVDGYHFSYDYQKTIKESGSVLLVIDDYGHAGRYVADLILNQNISAASDFYADRDRDTDLLLGTRYALLRREFRSWHGWTRLVPERASRILVTLGGSDPENLTVKVLEALERVDVDGLEIKVAVGSGNPHYKELQAAAARSSFPVDLEGDGLDMPQLMIWADLAISAAGSTCWELAFMGLPSLIIVSADNQRASAQRLHELGAAINLGWHGSLTQGEIARVLSDLTKQAGQRQKISQCGKELVDGMGAGRVSLALIEQILTFRRVSEDDVRLVWEWANDPVTRAASFSSEPIPWSEHVRWFESKLKNENCLFFLVTTEDGLPLGQVRYDRDGGEAVISVGLGESFRGQGYGSAIIRLGCSKMMATERINLIHAFVKQDNESSRRAFIKAGFEEAGFTNINGQEALHLVVRGDKIF